jgi:hypothetical protein
VTIGDEYVTCRRPAHPFSINDEAGAITNPETGIKRIVKP